MQALSKIYSSIVRGREAPRRELCVANSMLLSAMTGNLTDFKQYLEELYLLKNKTLDALIVTDENGWTALQIAAATDQPLIVTEILRSIQEHDLFVEPIIDFAEDGETTALILALNNGYPAIARSLLDSGASLEGSAPRNRNSVFLMCRGGYIDILTKVVDKVGAPEVKRYAECLDTNGYNSLHVAALMGNDNVCNLLLGLGLDLSQTTRDGSNALHIAARNLKHQNSESSKKTMAALIDQSPAKPMLQADTFGSSPLHVAVSCSNIEAVKIILRRFPVTSLICQDNDGLHPTNAACQYLCSLLYQRHSEVDESTPQGLALKILNATCCIQELVVAGYPLDIVDYSGYTVFHNLCSYPYEEVLQLTGFMIDAIDLSGHCCDYMSTQDILEMEASNGLTCLHNAYQNEGPCKGQLIQLLRKNMSVEFLASFDENKVKKDNKVSRNRCGAHNRVPMEVRRSILNEEHTLASIARYLRSLSRPPKIVVLIGAGISTSAGIPDFRSTNGLYANNATSNMFSVEFLMESPDLFYGRIRDMFLPVVDGTIRPTKTHALLKVLKDVGWLQRVYTQNIDMLEYPMLSDEDVVECHGSCRAARCVNISCSTRIREATEMELYFWGPIRKAQSPKCPECSQYLRPDVVFFGEPLPERFNRLCFNDLSTCDLLLVMGTTLLVYPVASLPQMVGPQCVRLLINREPSGCFQEVPPGNASDASGMNSSGSTLQAQPGDDTSTFFADNSNVSLTRQNFHQYETKMYRDVFYQGNCDEGAVELAAALGLEPKLSTVILEHC